MYCYLCSINKLGWSAPLCIFFSKGMIIPQPYQVASSLGLETPPHMGTSNHGAWDKVPNFSSWLVARWICLVLCYKQHGCDLIGLRILMHGSLWKQSLRKVSDCNQMLLLHIHVPASYFDIWNSQCNGSCSLLSICWHPRHQVILPLGKMCTLTMNQVNT